MLRALERKSRDDWVSVSRQQIAFVDDLVRRRSALSSLLNRLESELLSDGLLIMAKVNRGETPFTPVSWSPVLRSFMSLFA